MKKSDGNAEALLQALRFWSADRFRTLQRSLTTARKAIDGQLLSVNFRPLLTQKEIDTLTEASRIMAAVGDRVIHAKERRTREEKQRNQHLEAMRQQRLKLLAKRLPKPDTVEGMREVLLLRLALAYFYTQYTSKKTYYPELSFVEADLDRVLRGEQHSTLEGACRSWLRDVSAWLEEYLWPYDESPDEERLITLMQRFRSEWIAEVEKLSAELVQRFDQAQQVKAADNVERLDKKIKKKKV